MHHARSRAAWSLLVAGLTTALLLSTGRAATTRPHPLFGNPVIGNSAEIVTMWPTGTDGVDSLRITDFVANPPPVSLIPRPPGGLTGGPTDAKYQQLDVVAGDFDGDDRDELVAAHSQPTADPWTQQLVLTVPEIRDATLDWTSSHSELLGSVRLPLGSYRSPSLVRLVAGNFDPSLADTQQFILARRVQDGVGGRIEIDLMRLDSGVPVTLATTLGQYQDDGLKESVRFDVAAGDFDGDGLDEIVVGGVRRNASSNVEVFVTIYAYEGGALVEKASRSDGNWA